MCLPGLTGSKKKSHSADSDYAAETARRAAAVKEGMAGIDANFAAFDDGFYRRRQKDYEAWATPQADDQYKKALEQLTFALSRNGTINSSIGADEIGKLDLQRKGARRGIVDAARAAADSARSDVAAARGELVNQLNTTYDPTATLTSAQSRMQLLNSQPAYASLGDLFTLPAALGANAITNERLNGGYSGSGAKLFQSPTDGGPTRLVG